MYKYLCYKDLDIKKARLSDELNFWDWHDSNVRPSPPQSVSIFQKHSMLLYTKLFINIFYCIISKNTRLDFFVVLSSFESYRVILSYIQLFIQSNIHFIIFFQFRLLRPYFIPPPLSKSLLVLEVSLSSKGSKQTALSFRFTSLRSIPSQTVCI